MRTGAVILAAGMSSRMGDFKPMLKMGAISLAERIIANFQQADVSPIVVVTGFRAQELEKHISKLGVISLRNEEYERTEMIDSAKLGFSFIKDKCERAFFTPVDIPLFTLNTLSALMNAPVRDREGRAYDVIKPVCSGVDGHPILLTSALMERLISSRAKEGLRRAMEEAGAYTSTVEVGDEGILFDADTPAQYTELIEKHNEQLLRPVVDISIMREGKLFDRSAEMLLELVEYSGTVKDACEKAGISYSKAWKMLSDIEKNLGMPLIDRRQGGEAGGQSRLTREGVKLIERYTLYANSVRKYAEASFDEFFGDMQL